MIVCGTGHRPTKLGGYGNDVADKLYDVAYDWLSDRVNDIELVISGGALGWDQALAHAALSAEIPLVMALPFKGFESKWPKSSQDFLHELMQSAKIEYVCEEGYAPWKMQKRNEWMVDHADTVLALWDGSSGGTGNCIAYANKVGKPIVNLWEMYNGR